MRYNQLTIAGHLGGDAETRTTTGGSVTSFSVAVSGYKKDSESQWFRCSLWGERGEKLAQYLTKGKAVIVSGEVSVRVFAAKDGTPRGSLEVRADKVEFCGGGKAAPAAEPDSNPVAVDDSEIPF